MTIGVGIVGCGGMGAWHASNVAAQPGVAVVAVADVVTSAAEAVADTVGARVVRPDELIAATDVEAVLIASNDESHASFACSTIDAGKWCFLEKPIGATVEDAQAVLDAEVAHGNRLTRVGFMRELDPAHLQVLAALEQMGPITRVRCVHRNVDAAPRDVDLLFSQSLVHDIHTIRWLTGREFSSVTAHVVTRPDGFRDVLLVAELDDGSIATIDFEDQAFAYEVQVEVSAVGGMVATLPHPRAISRRQASESLAVGTGWFARFEDAYRVEMEHWARDLVAGTVSGPSVWDGYAAQIVARSGVVAMASGSRCEVAMPDRPVMYGGRQ